MQSLADAEDGSRPRRTNIKKLITFSSEKEITKTTLPY
mgnify:FL=1